MDREMMKNVLHDLVSGDSTTIDEDTLGMLFPPGEAAGVIDEWTRIKATAFHTITSHPRRLVSLAEI